MKKILLLISFILIGIYIMPFSVALNYYQCPFYVSNKTAIAKNPTFLLNNFNGEVNLTMECLSYISGSGSSTCSYYAPLNTTKAISATNNEGNCKNIGIYTYKNSQSTNNIESMMGLTSSSATYYLKPKTTMKINTNVQYLNFLTNNDKDINKHFKNLIGNHSYWNSIGLDIPTFVHNATDAYYKLINCVATNQYDIRLQPITNVTYAWGSGGTRGANYILLFPFNSSYSGILYYNVSLINLSCSCAAGSCTSDLSNGYVQLDGNNNVVEINQLTTAQGTLNLNINSLYLFYTAVHSYGSTTSGSCYFKSGDYYANFTLNIGTPDWSCGVWSDCSGGTKSRICHDDNGLLADYLENEVCYTLPEKSINIGFENSTSVNVFYSQSQYWAVYCPFCIDVKNIEYPTDWTINNFTNPKINNNCTYLLCPSNEISGYVYDNLKMTTEETKNGLKSLKLWSIPPEQHIPYCPSSTTGLRCTENLTDCLNPDGNYTYNLLPQVDKPINESYMLSRNITFGYPNMTVSMYIKKCKEPEQQYSGNTSIFRDVGGFLGQELCFDGYYTFDKTKNHNVENTKIVFGLLNLNTSDYYYVGAETKTNKWEKYEIQLINVSTTNLYKITLGLWSNSPVDSNIYCAYIDDININAYVGEINCESHCGDVNIGENPKSYYQLSNENEFGCGFVEQSPSPICDLTHEAEIGNCISYCSSCNKDDSDYLDYYIADNSTETCEYEIQHNANYCIEFCKTQNIKKPTYNISEISEKLSPFWSPMFLILIIIIAIAVIVAIKTKSWQMGLGILIVMILIASITWSEFAFIGIIIVIALVFLLASKFVQGTQGNNN